MRHLIPAIILLAMAHALAAADAAQIRAVADKAGPAVVALRVVTEMKLAMMNQNHTYDREAEAVGVILDADGTTAVGLFDLDPASMLKSMLAGNAMIKIEDELKECTAILSDGSEVAMAVALKDHAMGLAILRPKEPGRSFPFLAPADGRRLQLGDRALLVSRAPRHLASTILVSETQVIGAVAGKQPYALIDREQAISAAVCDLDGQLVGVSCAREAPPPSADGGAEPDPLKSLSFSMDAKAHLPTPIVLSAEAVAKLVALAKGKGAAAK